MRLINTTTLTLEFFPGKHVPEYAILSHTWGDDEVSFQEMSGIVHFHLKSRKGYIKILNAAKIARQDGWDYIWIDTCCINKDSSSELSEAINSMFSWYRDAHVCYAYLADVQPHQDMSDLSDNFTQCRWFSRGWTLQELLAPRHLIFYDQAWYDIGTKGTLTEAISKVTGIGTRNLVTQEYLKCCVAQKMYWASKRETTRGEDMAYCLMGIFGVSMPLLYGEGSEKSFLRLQEEIMKTSDDHSIFAWIPQTFPLPHQLHFRGFFAHPPVEFQNSGHIFANSQGYQCPPYQMTNKGLQISLVLLPDDHRHEVKGVYFMAVLNCNSNAAPQINRDATDELLVLQMKKVSPSSNTYHRVIEHWPLLLVTERFPRSNWSVIKPTPIFITEPHASGESPCLSIDISTLVECNDCHFICSHKINSDVWGAALGVDSSTHLIPGAIARWIAERPNTPRNDQVIELKFSLGSRAQFYVGIVQDFDGGLLFSVQYKSLPLRVRYPYNGWQRDRLVKSIGHHNVAIRYGRLKSPDREVGSLLCAVTITIRHSTESPSTQT